MYDSLLLGGFGELGCFFLGCCLYVFEGKEFDVFRKRQAQRLSPPLLMSESPGTSPQHDGSSSSAAPAPQEPALPR